MQIDDYVGNWTYTHNNATISCDVVSDMNIECTFSIVPRHLTNPQTFTVNGARIKWEDTLHRVCIGKVVTGVGHFKGNYGDDGTIDWNTGNDWIKLGKGDQYYSQPICQMVLTELNSYVIMACDYFNFLFTIESVESDARNNLLAGLRFGVGKNVPCFRIIYNCGNPLERTKVLGDLCLKN